MVSVVLWPVAAVEPGVNVNVVEPLVVTLVGAKAAVTPVGKPATEKLTAPVKPLAGVSVIESVAETPPKQNKKTHVGGVTVTLAVFGVRLKLLGSVTEKDWVTEGAAA
jgi:hypothetical protein